MDHTGHKTAVINPLSEAGALETFTTGSLVRDSGLYTVFHSAHHLPYEVVLIEGEPFPRCSRCAGRVIFELRKAAHAFSWAPYSAVRLHELPVSDFDGDCSPSVFLRENRMRRLRRAEAGLRERSRRKKVITSSRQLRTASRNLCRRAKELVAKSQSRVPTCGPLTYS